jgi:hypothetical protein
MDFKAALMLEVKLRLSDQRQSTRVVDVRPAFSGDHYEREKYRRSKTHIGTPAKSPGRMTIRHRIIPGVGEYIEGPRGYRAYKRNMRNAGGAEYVRGIQDARMRRRTGRATAEDMMNANRGADTVIQRRLGKDLRSRSRRRQESARYYLSERPGYKPE